MILFASLSMNHVNHTILRQFLQWVQTQRILFAKASASAAQSPCNNIVGALSCMQYMHQTDICQDRFVVQQQ